MAKNFKDEIKEALKGQKPELQVLFAWRCAVRVLPYLAKDGKISCWQEADTQKHLYWSVYLYCYKKSKGIILKDYGKKV